MTGKRDVHIRPDTRSYTEHAEKYLRAIRDLNEIGTEQVDEEALRLIVEVGSLAREWFRVALMADRVFSWLPKAPRGIEVVASNDLQATIRVERDWLWSLACVVCGRDDLLEKARGTHG